MAEIRAYDEADHEAVVRIWKEVGWIDDDSQADALAAFLRNGSALVATIDGEAEVLTHRTPGSIRYVDRDLSLCAVTAVTTSRVARKLGLASRLTGQLLADAAAEGAAVAALGMFEQGFYDRLGFGSGSYEHVLTLDPSLLDVEVPDRPPVRLTAADAKELHELNLRRHRTHGGISLDSPTAFEAELSWLEKGFGLGFRADDGRLTHALYGEGKEENVAAVEHLLYETPEQCLELLGLIRSLGDQWIHVTMPEPTVVQLQDLTSSPMRQRSLRRRTDTPAHTAVAWWQARILDLPACVAARSWPGEPVRFVLRLTDPLSARDDVAWDGVAGDWTVTLADESGAEPGAVDGLPVLTSGIAAFSRLWMGVRPATSLALTTDLDGPTELLADLDRAFSLPPPHPGLYF